MTNIVAGITSGDKNRSFLEHPFWLAVFGEVPGASALVTYWVETVRGRREVATQKFLNDIVTRLQALEADSLEGDRANPLDPLHISTVAYSETLAAVTDIASRDPDEAKTKYLLNFVTNYAKVRRPDVSLKQLFLIYTRDLSGTHLSILDYVAKGAASLSRDDLAVLRSSPERSEVVSEAKLAEDLHLEADLVDALLVGLASTGLIARIEASKNSRDRSRRAVVNPLGLSFSRFLNGTW